MKHGLLLIALLAGAGASLAQSPSVAPSPATTPATPPSVAAAPSVAPSVVASWAHLPPVPEPAQPSAAEKRGLELNIFYTTNILGEIDPCG